MSYEEVASHELAAVVTFLEMRHPPTQRPTTSDLALRCIDHPQLDQYRSLFRLIGSPWLWFSRLAMKDEELAAIIQHRAVELYAVTAPDGREVGILELDFRQSGECELAFVGLIPELSGQGHGRWLLTEALRLAWREEVRRVHVHTCTLDHPAALSAYRQAGFRAFKRAVERFPDPRLRGILPREAAPQVPLLGTNTVASRFAS